MFVMTRPGPIFSCCAGFPGEVEAAAEEEVDGAQEGRVGADDADVDFRAGWGKVVSWRESLEEAGKGKGKRAYRRQQMLSTTAPVIEER